MSLCKLSEIIIGVCCQITQRPSLFPIGSLYQFLVTIGPFFCPVLENDLPVHRNILECTVDEEVILKQHWTVLYSDFEEVSKKYYFSG
jgi:hypothetical protein